MLPICAAPQRRAAFRESLAQLFPWFIGHSSLYPCTWPARSGRGARDYDRMPLHDQTLGSLWPTMQPLEAQMNRKQRKSSRRRHGKSVRTNRIRTPLARSKRRNPRVLKVPFGYRRARSAKATKDARGEGPIVYCIDPKLRPIVAVVYERAAAGESLATIAQFLTRSKRS